MRLTLPALAIAVLLSTASAQTPPDLSRDTLARIGTGGITARDLTQRLELMPFPDKTKKVDSDTIKARALRAMIAEKVLANEYRRLGLPREGNLVLMQHELENGLIRDELYRRHVVDRIEVAPSEISEGLNRITKVNTVLCFLVTDEEAARNLTTALRTAKRDSVLRAIPASLYTECDTIRITFGAPDTSFERAAFAIGKGRVSGPVFSSQLGWAVLYLLDRTTDKEVAGLSLADRSNRVEKIVRARHEAALYEKCYASVLATRHATADSALFALFADSLSALWMEDTSHFRSKGFYILTGDLVDLLIFRLRPELDKAIVALDDGTLSLGALLEMFRYVDFQSKAAVGMEMRLELNEAIRKLIGNELLAREGRNEGFQNAPAVRNELNVWSDYWDARALFYRVRDSVKVSEAEIIAHLVKNAAIFGSYFEVNVRELLCDSLRTMDEAVRALDGGQTLSDVATRYSTRREWAARGGESGFFRVGLHPELGFEAMNTDSGKLAGPVKLPEGYSLFQVLGKRMTKSAVTNYDILKRNVRARLLAEKQKRTVDQYIADLVREQRVAVDYDKVKRLNYNRVPMFTRRLLGFGGRMSAAPILMRQWDWIREYQPPNEVIP